VTNQYTSVAAGTGVSAAGLSVELVQDALDLMVKAALREIPTARMFVDSRPGNPNMKGATITLEKTEWFDRDAVIAAATPLNEEADVDSVRAPKPTPVTVTPDEYGFVVTRTRKFANRAFTPPDPIIAQQVAQHQAEVIDYLVQTTMQTGSNVRYANLHEDATTTATDVDEIAADNLINSKDIRRVVTTLRANKALPWYGNTIACLIHPDVILDLREETGADGWRAPQVYGTDQSKIWLGEVGEYEGVRFVQNALVHKAANEALSPVDVYQTYFFGKNAIVEWVLEEPHAVISPQTDKLGRFHSVGWYGDLGWNVYEDKALYRLLSTASIANEATGS
jgi:N4-gp56 family major capsid protein